MQINITVKQLGKKHPFLKDVPLELEGIGHTPTLNTFLLAVVQQQVEAFNLRKNENNVLPFLTQKAIDSQAIDGKISFRESYNNTKADLQKAQIRMLEAFEDGLFAVFQGEERLEDLQHIISLDTTSSFTFLRFAFLSGSYYQF